MCADLGARNPIGESRNIITFQIRQVFSTALCQTTKQTNRKLMVQDRAEQDYLNILDLMHFDILFTLLPIVIPIVNVLFLSHFQDIQLFVCFGTQSPGSNAAIGGGFVTTVTSVPCRAPWLAGSHTHVTERIT